MNLRSRMALALFSALLSTGCGAEQSESETPAVSIAAAPTLELLYPPATRQAHALAFSFLTVTLKYDAVSVGRADFLEAAGRLATRTEVERLKESSRAQLPWRVLRVRGERTELRIDGITQTAAPDPTVRVLVRLTVATHTEFATVRVVEQVTLTLVHTTGGWRVAHASGAGL